MDIDDVSGLYGQSERQSEQTTDSSRMISIIPRRTNRNPAIIANERLTEAVEEMCRFVERHNALLDSEKGVISRLSLKLAQRTQRDGLAGSFTLQRDVMLMAIS